MKRSVRLLAFGVLGALAISGCAIEEVVKKDDAMVPSATTQTKQMDAKNVKENSAKTSTMTPTKQATNNAKKESIVETYHAGSAFVSMMESKSGAEFS